MDRRVHLHGRCSAHVQACPQCPVQPLLLSWRWLASLRRHLPLQTPKPFIFKSGSPSKTICLHSEIQCWILLCRFPHVR